MNTKPYYAVIFTSTRTKKDDKGYAEMAQKMEELAKKQEGFLGIETAKSELGITVSYWKDLRSILRWKKNAEHLQAQKKGKEEWYSWYKIRISLILREYDFSET